MTASRRGASTDGLGVEGGTVAGADADKTDGLGGAAASIAAAAGPTAFASNDAVLTIGTLALVAGSAAVLDRTSGDDTPACVPDGVGDALGTRVAGGERAATRSGSGAAAAPVVGASAGAGAVSTSGETAASRSSGGNATRSPGAITSGAWSSGSGFGTITGSPVNGGASGGAIAKVWRGGETGTAVGTGGSPVSIAGAGATGDGSEATEAPPLSTGGSGAGIIAIVRRGGATVVAVGAGRRLSA